MAQAKMKGVLVRERTGMQQAVQNRRRNKVNTPISSKVVRKVVRKVVKVDFVANLVHTHEDDILSSACCVNVADHCSPPTCGYDPTRHGLQL